MRILLSSNHRFPAAGLAGTGRVPREWPSGSGFIVHDLVAKGLAELGHEVYYRLPKGADCPLPPGVTPVEDAVAGIDVLHTMTFRDHDLVRATQRAGVACVATCHLDPTVPGRTIDEPIEDHWIFVSRTLAHSLGRTRYVLNGIDPAEFRYRESKDDYFLFMASLEWTYMKGLDIALDLARRMGIRVIVAGTAKTAAVVERVAAECADAGAELVGDVRHERRAELLAGARGVLFPTRVNEAFGLVMAEAMMSGTPVIASANGACPEVVSPNAGFVCRARHEYEEAVERIGEISPAACRAKAMAEFHYLRMARDYVREYESEIAHTGRRRAAMAESR